MKRSARRVIAIAVSVAMSCNSMTALAAGPVRSNPVPSGRLQLVSDRLIVKYKASNLARGMSVAQIRAQLSQPLSAQAVGQLQSAAGMALAEMRAIPSGAHVLAMAGRPDRQTLDKAIAAISALPGIEYVEEDAIMTAQVAPTDPYYSPSGPTGNPGLWGLWPAATVVSPAPGGTGSYGADFETAWATSSGNGVVVAVIDTGITPHVDIVGASGVVAAGAGSNLVSVGYDFISDCRMLGSGGRSCANTTPSASAVVVPAPDATDLGDFISASDCTTAGSVFNVPGCAVSPSTWHGTHVAGTIAALGNNAVGVIGGAYNALILPVRVLGKSGGYLSDITDGILWAAGVHPSIANPVPTRARVINLSLGGDSATCGPTYQNAINAAVAAGAVVVVAAGNGDPATGFGLDVANSRPANCQNVITVAAVGRDGSRAVYSNFSSPASNITNPVNVTLAAPGGDDTLNSSPTPPLYDPGILSTLNSGTTTPVLSGGSSYGYHQGTSMATPHVAAAVALMLARNPALTPAQVKAILTAPSSLTPFPSFTPAGWASYDCATKRNCGAGILNANLAVQNSAAPVLTAAAIADFGAASVNTTVSSIVAFTNSSAGAITLGSAAVGGTNAAVFSIASDTCSGQAIAASATCQVTMHYSPSAVGIHTATLTLPDVTSARSTFVALTGSAGSRLTTTTPVVTAATVTLGGSTTVNLTYSNPNWIALPIGSLSLSQPSIMAASADGCSNITLGAGASCTVTVTVTPGVVGSYSGTASLSLTGGGVPAVASISGLAIAPPVPSSGGGGGCSVMPSGGSADLSLLLAMLAVAGYWLRRRFLKRSAG